MNFAAIDWLSISINLLLVVFVIVCLLMILLVLMQRPKQEGLGAAFGGGVTDQLLGASTTNVLQRGTAYLGSLFFLISLVLAILIGQQNKKTSIITPEKPAAAEQAATKQTLEEVKPASLAEELQVALPEQTNDKVKLPATTETPAETSEPAIDGSSADKKTEP